MGFHTGVIGASGYTGAELLRLLGGHADLAVEFVTADSQVGRRVGDLYPSLAPLYGDATYVAPDPSAVTGLDLVFVALPHGASQALMPALVDAVGHVVDLGADFRLPSDLYATWYGVEHTAPELLDAFSYGIPELFGEDLMNKPHVAAAGCYPTTTILALAPMIAAELIEPTGIVVNACSGISGRGRGLSTPSLFAEANENVQAYGVGHHRHTGEIEMGLSRVGGVDVQVLFTPHLVPMTRGLVSTCVARPKPKTDGLSTPMLMETMRTFYAEAPFVHVTDEAPATRSTYGSNACHVSVQYDERTNSVVALGALDNLGKGAAGQAVQCANRLLGLSEAAGLSSVGVAP